MKRSWNCRPLSRQRAISGRNETLQGSVWLRSRTTSEARRVGRMVWTLRPFARDGCHVGVVNDDPLESGGGNGDGKEGKGAKKNGNKRVCAMKSDSRRIALGRSGIGRCAAIIPAAGPNCSLASTFSGEWLLKRDDAHGYKHQPRFRYRSSARRQEFDPSGDFAGRRSGILSGKFGSNCRSLLTGDFWRRGFRPERTGGSQSGVGWHLTG